MFIKAVRTLGNSEVYTYSNQSVYFILISLIQQLNKAELSTVVPPAISMSIAIAASTSTGKPLDKPQWLAVERACDLADRLEEARRKVGFQATVV